MHTASLILAFGFGHLAMLGWLAAAALPLLIHLWNRRKYREVPWAAVSFLLEAMRKNARRVRLEQWLLLAVRTLLIALVVFALAEPFWERVGWNMVAGERTHHVLVIDASMSMAYRPTDQSRFDRAKQLATRIVDESNRGDGFTLITMGRPPKVLVGSPTFEPASILDEIENLTLTHGGADLSATVERIEEVVARARKENPRLAQQEVYFITDMQRVTWAPEVEDSDAASDFRRRSQRLADQAALVLIDVGQAAADNVAVTDLRTADALATIARDVVIEAQIRNFGRRQRPQQLVELHVDGRRAGEQHVDLDADAQAHVVFSYRFDRGGEHAVEVRAGGDALDVDNHRYLALPVKDVIRVLCVNGRPGGVGFRGATDYLMVALTPSGDDERSLIDAEAVPESALLELDLDRYDCVFLCNVGQFTANESRVLANYVQRGGGLVFFLGDHVQPDSYNRHLGSDAPDDRRLLPVVLGETVPEGEYRFHPLEYRHPIVRPFRGQERAGLLTTPISRYMRLSVPESSQARVALAFNTGDPAIVEEQIGRGRSIVVATSSDISWTAMPMWSSYLPIVHELLMAATGGQTQQRNVEVGESVGSSVPTLASDVIVDLTTPAGETASLRLAPQGTYGRWDFAETDHSGIYTAELGPPVGTQQLFAINVDTRQSDLEPIAIDELREAVWAGVPFLHHTTWQNIDQQPAAEVRRRASLHKTLLYAALGLLFLDTLLAWRFGHQAT